MRVRLIQVLARLLLLLVLIVPWVATAHEIPADARLNVFVVPSQKSVSVLMRVPLAAMGDIDYPTGPGNTLIVSKADAALHNAVALWIVPAISLFANEVQLSAPQVTAVRIALPSDRSFESWPTARAGIDALPLDDGLSLYWSQQMLDVLLEYPVASENPQLALDLRIDRFGETVTTALRLLSPDGTTRAFVLHGNAGQIELDPGWAQTAARFLQAGMEHILSGTDHLLFLACLVIPFPLVRPLIAIVTAFTLGHSISLTGSAFGLAPSALWFPPLIEALIAASILYMALENILGSDLRRRWVLAFGFGVVHGFGFSFGLGELMQFAGSNLMTSLAAFNLGVEIGQVTVLLLLVCVLRLWFRRLRSARLGVIVLSAMIAHIAWHWLEVRWGTLSKFPRPAIDVLLLMDLMQALVVGLVLGGLVWTVSGTLNRWLSRTPRTSRSPKAVPITANALSQTMDSQGGGSM